MTGIFPRAAMLSTVLVISPVLGEVNDPMRPPPLALQKFRLEKLKKNPPPPVAQKKQETEAPWILHSILFSDDRQHAIINNKLVKKGDSIRGARLVRLTPNSARLVNKGKIIDLDLYKRHESIRKSMHGGKP